MYLFHWTRIPDKAIELAQSQTLNTFDHGHNIALIVAGVFQGTNPGPTVIPRDDSLQG